MTECIRTESDAGRWLGTWAGSRNPYNELSATMSAPAYIYIIHAVSIKRTRLAVPSRDLWKKTEILPSEQYSGNSRTPSCPTVSSLSRPHSYTGKWNYNAHRLLELTIGLVVSDTAAWMLICGNHLLPTRLFLDRLGLYDVICKQS